MPPRPPLVRYAHCKHKVKTNSSSTWNRLITDHVKHGRPLHAVALYDRMQEDQLVPSPHAFVALIKACRTLNDVEKGKELHETLRRNGLLSEDPFIGSALINMYSKCGMLGNAQEAFDNLPFRTSVTWTVLIVGYLEHGRVDESMSCFERLQIEGLSPDCTTFVCVLKACSASGTISKGQVIHQTIVGIGLEGNSVVGCSIVGMYASCGSFVEATHVFYQIADRDVVLWTALIAGYIKHGYGDEAFSCLGKMRLEGVSPNNVTFMCILKACGSMKNIVKGNEIHREITERGMLRTDTCLGNELVNMYATCGKLVDAQQVFEKIADRDIVSWNVLMAGYIEHEQYQEVLNCYEEMHLSKITPNSVSLIYCLKACGGLKAIEKGQEFHGEIERDGLGADLLLGSTLIEMYMNCGLFGKAKEVFDNLATQDIVSWTALIAGYEKLGCFEEALASFEKMQCNGHSPNAVTLVSILKACGGCGSLDKGQELYAEISRKGFVERDVGIGYALIDMYTECSLLSRAHEVSNNLPIQDVVSWNMIMTGYVRHGLCDKALDLFTKMQLEGHLPNDITYISSLRACKNVEEVSNEGMKLHARIVGDSSVKVNPNICRSLLDMYARCGMLSSAKQFFEMIVIQDTFSWNALLAGFANHGCAEEALDCIKKMQEHSVPFNSTTVIINMKVCSILGAIEKLQKIHDEVLFNGLIETDEVIGNALVDAYMKCGSLKKAIEVFDELSHRDIVSWNTIITGCVNWGYSEECLYYFEAMQLDGASPNIVTFLLCLKACSSAGALNKGENIHSEIARLGLSKTDHSIGNALVDMYAKCGLVSLAEEVFVSLAIQDLVSWTALLAGYAQLGDCENVFRILEEMLENGQKANLITLNSVLNACNHAGLVEQAECCFLEMVKVHEMYPTVEQYSCILDLLSRSGQLEKTAIMILEMPFQPDLVVWNIFLGACRKWGNVEMARCAFSHATYLDEKDVTAYVCMRNIYADAGMKEEATKIEAIRLRNLCPE